MRKMYYKNEKHYYYCMRKKLNKNFKLNDIITEQELYDAASSIYNLTIDICDELNQKHLRFPTDYYSYVLFHCKSASELKYFIESYNDIIAEYMEIVDMSLDEIQSNISVYNEFAIKYHFEATPQRDEYRDSQYSTELVNLMDSLKDVSGVYKLYNENKELIYIGKSYRLGKRMFSSKRERNAAYFSYSVIENKSDTDIYEVYYISKLKPPLNGTNVTKDSPTIMLKDVEFSQLREFV